jgi:hypothetical protein
MAEMQKLLRSPVRDYTRGLGTSIAREGFYTFFHYNTYRYLKDDVFMEKLKE